MLELEKFEGSRNEAMSEVKDAKEKRKLDPYQ